jgi:hypothetical protein
MMADIEIEWPPNIKAVCSISSSSFWTVVGLAASSSFWTSSKITKSGRRMVPSARVWVAPRQLSKGRAIRIFPEDFSPGIVGITIRSASH